jgi:hypothetical protein
MIRILGFALAAVCAPALAASWIPYTDGRMGGCFLSDQGVMFGCTPQPPTAAPPPIRETVYVENPRTQRELEATRRELDAVRAHQQQEQNQRNYEAAQRTAQRNAEIEAHNREVEAWNAEVRRQEGVRDSRRIQALSKKTESCREQLAKVGYKVVGPGACKTADGVYVTCPGC